MDQYHNRNYCYSTGPLTALSQQTVGELTMFSICMLLTTAPSGIWLNWPYVTFGGHPWKVLSTEMSKPRTDFAHRCLPAIQCCNNTRQVTHYLKTLSLNYRFWKLQRSNNGNSIGGNWHCTVLSVSQLTEHTDAHKVWSLLTEHLYEETPNTVNATDSCQCLRDVMSVYTVLWQPFHPISLYTAMKATFACISRSPSSIIITTRSDKS